MKLIALNKGLYAKVDDDDYEWLNDLKGWIVSSQGYAVLPVSKNGKSRHLHMHRLILLVTDPKQIIDHANHDRLDNQRLNIRKCTFRQNSGNAQKRYAGRVTTSRFKGVSRHKHKWQATIRAQGKQKYLGLFEDEKLAAKAYDDAARIAFGEFAYLNLT